MRILQALTVLPALALAAIAFAPSAHAQPTNPQQVSVGGVIDVLLQNTNVQIPVNVRENQIGLVNLNNVLNNTQVTALNNILNGSNVLSGIRIDVQNVLNDNTVLTDFLNNNNIAISDVVAVDVLSGGRITVFYLPTGI